MPVPSRSPNRGRHRDCGLIDVRAREKARRQDQLLSAEFANCDVERAFVGLQEAEIEDAGQVANPLHSPTVVEEEAVGLLLESELPGQGFMTRGPLPVATEGRIGSMSPPPHSRRAFRLKSCSWSIRSM